MTIVVFCDIRHHMVKMWSGRVSLYSKKNLRNDWSLWQLKKDTEDEISKVKNACNKKLPDISVCKRNLQGPQE